MAVFERDRLAGGRADCGGWAEGAPALPCPPNVWGTVVHRLLAEFGRKGSLPSAQGTSTALRQLGIESSGTLRIACAALSQVKSCLDDPWLQAFYRVPPERRRVEWPVECIHGQEGIYSGVIDLAAEIEGKWNLVDFKTAEPLEGESVEDFLRREIEEYRPQILAYGEIWAKVTGTDQAQLHAFLYWTALRQWSVVSGQWSVDSGQKKTT